MNKKLISILSVGLISVTMLVGCNDSKKVENTEQAKVEEIQFDNEKEYFDSMKTDKINIIYSEYNNLVHIYDQTIDYNMLSDFRDMAYKKGQDYARQIMGINDLEHDIIQNNMKIKNEVKEKFGKDVVIKYNIYIEDMDEVLLLIQDDKIISDSFYIE